MTERQATVPDRERRLMEMTRGFIAVWEGFVNIEDLVNAKPGGIVRCRRAPSECISIVHPDLSSAGCVAGWISEEE